MADEVVKLGEKNETAGADAVPADDVVRDARGRWVKGTKSPNKGGYRWRKSETAYAMFEEEQEDVIRAVLEKAKDGDTSAMKLVLDRLVPARKSAPVRIDLPEINNSTDAQRAISLVLAAQASGELTADEATAFTQTIETFIRAVAVADLEAKVAALTEQMKP